MNYGYSDFTSSAGRTDIRDLVFSSAINPATSNPQNFYIEGSYDISEWKLKSVCIPLSFYLIREGINDKLFIEEAGEDGLDMEITLSEGNYTPNQMVAFLKNRLDAISENIYDVHYVPQLGKLHISCPNEFRVLKSSTASHELGIKNDSEFSTEWWADEIADFSGPSMIHVACQQLGTKQDLVGSNQRILASIPITAPPGGIEVYREGDSDFYKVSSHLSNIEFKFLDDHLRPLKLENANTVIVLTVKVKI